MRRQRTGIVGDSDALTLGHAPPGFTGVAECL
jgi:hypothetical protein